LKAKDGKPIVAHVGADFARSLIAQGLVDQYALLVHPIALGKGLAILWKKQYKLETYREDRCRAWSSSQRSTHRHLAT
jgi:dihydrofolate reductase